MMKKPIILSSMVLVASVLFTSCASNAIKASETKPRLQFTGFSIGRPPNDAWVALPGEQDYTKAMIRKRCASETHTLVVSVNTRRLPKTPASPADLAGMEKVFHTFTDTNRFQVEKFTQIIETRQGQWSVRFTEQILDRGSPKSPGRPLVGRATGFVCVHPSFGNTVVFADCTERGLESELDDRLLQEGEALLQTVQVESAPGIPVHQQTKPE